MDMLHRFMDVICRRKERKRGKLRGLLYTAMPYYDSDYEGNWNMNKLIEKIMDICDGKEVEL